MLKRVAIVWVALLVGVALFSIGGGSDSESPPSTTSIQSKWGCEEDEIVYFTDPVTCISEEEHVRMRTDG